jgi:hypothetical protein
MVGFSASTPSSLHRCHSVVAGKEVSGLAGVEGAGGWGWLVTWWESVVAPNSLRVRVAVCTSPPPSPAPANNADDYGYTAIHAAASYGRVEVLRYLLSKGGSVKVTDMDGDTPLHACESPECARILLDAHADVNATNNAGRTPLYVPTTSCLLPTGFLPTAPPHPSTWQHPCVHARLWCSKSSPWWAPTMGERLPPVTAVRLRACVRDRHPHALTHVARLAAASWVTWVAGWAGAL